MIISGTGDDQLERIHYQDSQQTLLLIVDCNNQSIHSTMITILTKQWFSGQIMSVTGYKSVNSLAMYDRTSKWKNVQM